MLQNKCIHLLYVYRYLFVMCVIIFYENGHIVRIIYDRQANNLETNIPLQYIAPCLDII